MHAITLVSTKYLRIKYDFDDYSRHEKYLCTFFDFLRYMIVEVLERMIVESKKSNSLSHIIRRSRFFLEKSHRRGKIF